MPSDVIKRRILFVERAGEGDKSSLRDNTNIAIDTLPEQCR